MVFDDKDIPIDDDASCQESIANVDEEAKDGDEVTEDPEANHRDGDNVADTETDVEYHQPIKKGFGGLPHDEVEEVAIGRQYQHYGDTLACSEYLGVQRIFIIIMNDMLNLVKN